MIDRSLKYIDAYMIYRDLSVIPEFELPDGYSFRMYKDGDEKFWVDIEVSSGDISDTKTGFEKFEKYYGKYRKELEDRMVFVLNDNQEPVGTATGFFIDEDKIENSNMGKLHWVAIKNEYKGKGLSKPMITKVMQIMHELGHKGAILHSQTHTWLACKIYQSIGWEAYRPESQSIEEFSECWEIINSQK